jgi:hypothetical protein
MNDRPQQEPQRPKRVYARPELVQIPLRPEEAVLGNCKTAAGTAGPGGATNCQTPAPCFSIGS